MPVTSSAEAVQAPKQHVNPCADCPFLKESAPGWLGGSDPDAYIAMAHSNTMIDCHAIKKEDGTGWQCAGVACYRANILKVLPPPAMRGRKSLVVFATPTEFLAHHKGRV